jgi:hypothetical protein
MRNRGDGDGRVHGRQVTRPAPDAQSPDWRRCVRAPTEVECEA